MDNNKFEELKSKIAIRKLIPEETFILQGMTAADCQAARNVGVSDSQLYKISGNGLTTNCVQFLMEHLMKAFDPSIETTDEKCVKLYGECK